MKIGVRSSILTAVSVALTPVFLGATGSGGISHPDARGSNEFDTVRSGRPANHALVVGRVTDLATGLPIEKASVQMDRDNLTITTEEGRYVLAGVPAGFTRITVSVPGYVTQVRRVELLSDRFTQVDFALAAVSPPLQ